MPSKAINYVIRPMCNADINHVVRIHQEGFPNSRSTNLGKPFLRKMYLWFLTYYPELAFVAMIDEQAVGFVTGGVGGSSRRIFRYALLEILWGFLRRPWLLLQADMYEGWRSHLSGFMRRRGNSNIIPSTTGEAPFMRATLDSIAVSQQARGKHLGKSLVSAFEKAACQHGAIVLSLGVERDNTAARRLYESCGWALMRENVEMNSANYVKEIGSV